MITSCNSTKDELMQEAGGFNKGSIGAPQEIEITNDQFLPNFNTSVMFARILHLSLVGLKDLVLLQ